MAFVVTRERGELKKMLFFFFEESSFGSLAEKQYKTGYSSAFVSHKSVAGNCVR